ncbi:MAG TPA: hypothetical protein ENK43_00810 [Planctomycetes bacterium]|nr:hypothetical protein [Planctomycetota bacterium]
MKRSLIFFLLISVVAGAVLAGLIWFVAPALGFALTGRTLLAGAIGGFLVSTGGWLVVMRGFHDDPSRMFVWFGAGMLTKMVLLVGSLAVIVAGFGLGLREVVGPFAAEFLCLGFVQLGLAVKGLNDSRVKAGASSRGVSESTPPSPTSDRQVGLGSGPSASMDSRT